MESCDDGRNGEAEDLYIHGVKRPAPEASPERAFFGRLQFRIPTSQTIVCTHHDALPSPAAMGTRSTRMRQYKFLRRAATKLTLASAVVKAAAVRSGC